jgi:hypothetical protein
MEETRINTELFALSTVKPHAGMAVMRKLGREFSQARKREAQHSTIPVLIRLRPNL